MYSKLSPIILSVSYHPIRAPLAALGTMLLDSFQNESSLHTSHAILPLSPTAYRYIMYYFNKHFYKFLTDLYRKKGG